MSILVTGGTGLLGNNILRKLVEQNTRPIALARKTSDPRPLAGLPIERVEGDVTNLESLKRAAKDATGIIHCAGYVEIGWSRMDLHEAINVEGARNVASVALKLGIPMTHVSSINALGVSHGLNEVDEESADPGIVPCAYAVTKRRGEEVVLELVERGLRASIVNPGVMFGPWDWRPSSGRMLLAVGTGFAPVAPRGSCSVCDVRDVADGVLAAFERGEPGRRYILAGENVSYLEAWRRMAKVVGAHGPWMKAGPLMRFLGGAAGDLWGKITGSEPELNSAAVAISSQEHRFRSDRAIHELGYRIRPMEESFRDAWNWFVEHGYVKGRAARAAQLGAPSEP